MVRPGDMARGVGLLTAIVADDWLRPRLAIQARAEPAHGERPLATAGQGAAVWPAQLDATVTGLLEEPRRMRLDR